MACEEYDVDLEEIINIISLVMTLPNLAWLSGRTVGRLLAWTTGQISSKLMRESWMTS